MRRQRELELAQQAGDTLTATPEGPELDDPDEADLDDLDDPEASDEA